MKNNLFHGIEPTPNPKPNEYGVYVVVLTAVQFQMFQDNQKRPPPQSPTSPMAAGPSGSDQGATSPTDTVVVTKDPSMSGSHCCDKIIIMIKIYILKQ